ncbi:histone-lysine N-methyltransferase SETMAR-like [Saccostrea cucullata]|uniref:histone-lysine N-methyltransferase SETMAR-like n=1 Tax=Saccostrea cuccullata TaxID=36930 RepID=UPI002ED524D1
MVGNIEEIRAYIKVRTKLCNSVKQIFTELGEVYGSDKVSYETVHRWRQKFLTGTESVKDAAKSGRPVTVSGKRNVSKVKEIIESDGRYTVRDIAKAVGISLSRVHFILKRILKVRKISARWIPHILTDDQKKVRIQTAKRLLKMFPNFNQRQFANIVTGDETWVHYFEPVRKVGNKLWLTKHGRRPVVAKRTMSTKKVLYCIFFSCDGLAVQIPVPKGKSVTGRYYRCCTDVVLKKLKKYYQKRHPVSGFRHVRLLHDNAPSHTSELVKQFLKSEKVTVLPHPPYSPDLAPCDFFLFPKLKKFLSGRRYKSRQALGSAVSQCLRGIPKSAYREAFQKWIQRLKLYI